MAVLNTLMRWRRGESLVLAAILLACLFLPAAAQGAVLPPQNAQAVLLWLQSEMTPASAPRLAQTDDLRALQHRDSAPIYSHSPVVLPVLAEPQRLASLQIERRASFISPLESHEAAFLTGVRNNRWRN